MSNSRSYQNNEKGLPPKLPDLEMVRLVGSGAYGQVWLATNQITGHLVAVKVIHLSPTKASGRAAREIASLIRYEANVRNQYENLFAIHHVGQTEELLFYLMDAADDVTGRPASLDPDYRPATLETRLETGPLPLSDCLQYAKQLLAGLACLHNAGLVHRDIKPSNCLFLDGKLKLADFGLLTQIDGTQSTLGTPPYMPPDGHMDSRADVYAAGLVLYEMFTGLPVSCFPRLNPNVLQKGDEAILATLNTLVLRACQPDPSKRFKNGCEMLRVLERAGAKMQPKYQQSIRRLALLAAPVMVALVLTALWLRQFAAQRIHVNFITIPFEAKIYIDDTLLVDSQGRPYTTPCTVPNLTPKNYDVVFKREGYPDFNAGKIDFKKQQEIVVTWNPTENP